jgi:hypothetical protein
MTAEVLHNDDETMTIKVTVKKSAAFLECEENIQDAWIHTPSAHRFGRLREA